MSRWSVLWERRSPNWIGLALITVLFIGIGIWVFPQQPHPFPHYVSDSPSASGVKAFFTLLGNQKRNVAVWKQGIGPLPDASGRQLMMAVQPLRAIDSIEEKRWIDWMEKGNRIWLMDRDPSGVFELEWNMTQSSRPDDVHSIVGYDEWRGRFKATIKSKIRLVPGDSDRILLRDDVGVVTLARSYGKGELIVSITPEWITNGTILQHDHASLLLPIFDRGPTDTVWFNEAIHGYENKWEVIEAYPHWFIVLAVQALVILTFWIWRKGKRFGPIETPREWTVRFGDERIRTMAVWYERSRFYKEALSIQVEYVRFALQERWGISSSVEVSEMLILAKHRLSSEQEARWKTTWGQSETGIQAKNLPHREFVRLSQQLDLIRKEIERVPVTSRKLSKEIEIYESNNRASVT